MHTPAAIRLRSMSVDGYGKAKVRLPDGGICTAEIHWYEAHGVGRKEFKLKHILEGE